MRRRSGPALRRSGAANEVFLTQSAISRGVKTLESQIGQPLFRRLPNGLELTEAGSALQQAAADALRTIDVAVAGLGLEGPAARLRSSHYDQVIQVALEGGGVALGRWPLVAPLGRRPQSWTAHRIGAGFQDAQRRCGRCGASRPDSDGAPEAHPGVSGLARKLH